MKINFLIDILIPIFSFVDIRNYIQNHILVNDIDKFS